MSYSKSVSLVIGVVVCVAVAAGEASAQRRGGAGRPSGGGAVGRAVPRVYAPRAPITRGYYLTRFGPRIVNVFPYRPYFYPYRPGLTVGFYSGYGYPYRYGYSGYPYNSYYGYPYSSYYGYPYGSYGYAPPPPTYVTAMPGYSYGRVRIEGAPEEAQVFADGYYMGVVDDFDGAFQHLNLQAGAHRIEIRAPGLPPVTFDVNVIPGQTITYHAGIR